MEPKAERTDFKRPLPEKGEWLVFDYKANNSVQMVVRVVKVCAAKGYFVLSHDRLRARIDDGQVIGFETAIVRRDAKQVKKMKRKVAESRLAYTDYDRLPGRVLRDLNKILDAHEIQAKEMKARYAVGNTEIESPKNAFRGKTAKNKSNNTSKRSSLDDAPVKTSWGKRSKIQEDEESEDD